MDKLQSAGSVLVVGKDQIDTIILTTHPQIGGDTNVDKDSITAIFEKNLPGVKVIVLNGLSVNAVVTKF